MSCPYLRSNGAYVLGALSPAERTSYEAHLAGCPTCAAEVAQLAPVPGLLSRVDPASLSPAASGSIPFSRLLAAVGRERRRQARARRWRLAAAVLAATVLAVVGSVLWFDATSDPRGAPAMVAMTPLEVTVPVTAQVAVVPVEGGSEVWLSCQYPPYEHDDDEEPRTFRLVALGADGSHEQVGSWRAGTGDDVSLTGRTRYPTASLVRLELHDATGHPLLYYNVR